MSYVVFFFKQKTAYEMRISDWSSDVCSSDLECPTMQLANIELGKLSVSKANMRYGSKAPDVSDILPSIRARGVLVPLLVRPGPVPSDVEGGSTATFEIVA